MTIITYYPEPQDIVSILDKDVVTTRKRLTVLRKRTVETWILRASMCDVCETQLYQDKDDTTTVVQTSLGVFYMHPECYMNPPGE